MLISKVLNRVVFLFAPLVFNISRVLLDFSFERVYIFFASVQSLCHFATDRRCFVCNQGSLESTHHSHQTRPGAHVRCRRLSWYMLCAWRI